MMRKLSDFFVEELQKKPGFFRDRLGDKVAYDGLSQSHFKTGK